MSSRALACSLFPLLFATLGLAALGPAGCGGAPAQADTTTSSGGGHGGGPATTGTGGSSAGGGGHGGSETGGAGGTDAGAPDAASDDGTPERVACTGTFGNALNTTHGRLDGYLVSIVPTGQHACNGDSGHVHLQVKVNGAIYDVAVNTDVLYAAIDHPLVDGAWAEGWHPSIGLGYPQNLGLHTASFTTATPAEIVQKIESTVATANHVAIFATGYGPTGAHDVHYRGYGNDGALVIDPLSPTPHWLLFRFSTDSF